MTLEDINPETTYCWAILGELMNCDNPVEVSTNDFGLGRRNTEEVWAKWKENSNASEDIWGIIDDEIEEKWFLPSKSEWAAFGTALNIEMDDFENLGLSTSYWSSSQYSTSEAYYVDYLYCTIATLNMDGKINVRLSVSF